MCAFAEWTEEPPSDDLITLFCRLYKMAVAVNEALEPDYSARQPQTVVLRLVTVVDCSVMGRRRSDAPVVGM